MHWPQLVVLLLMILNVVGGIILDGQPRKPYNAFDIIAGTVITFLLLYIGGFFNFGGC